MKILPLLAAAAAVLVVPFTAAPAAAAGQDRVVVKTERHYDRHHNAHWKKVCRTTWRHHRKVTTCRRVRAWH